MRALSYIGAEKITFPPKPDRQTDILTYIQAYRRTDICFYRVTLLLKSKIGLNRIYRVAELNIIPNSPSIQH